MVLSSLPDRESLSMSEAVAEEERACDLADTQTQ